jgi:CubicO group peptidase (beta-lactamase class C family)
MSKTALASAIGSLICSKQIASIDDVMSKYSKSLLKTPYEDVTIRNALQMNSGVTPPGRKDVKKASAMAIGAKQYEGKPIF